MLCHFQSHIHAEKCLCITSDLSVKTFSQFWQEVLSEKTHIEQSAESAWALWQNDSYDFLVLFFAVLLADKQVILPPNRVRDLEKSLAAQNIYFIERQNKQINPVVEDTQHIDLNDYFLNRAAVFFYTSGSTGQPKKIPRTLKQLLNEVQGLDQSFDLAENALALATVSHQHIYGLLFKLLWPLASGRAFYNPQLAFPEDVVEARKKLQHLSHDHFGSNHYVVSSPALLKRWTSDVLLEQYSVVYSSGGKLDAGVRPLLNASITEIFGSSETGGIAYRTQDEALWTPFADVEIIVTDAGELGVLTQHAYINDWIYTADKVEVSVPDDRKSQFQLQGRLDRIVKLEEKRLSLDSIESGIVELPEVSECHTLIFEKDHRQILACVAVLSEQAQLELKHSHKRAFVAKIKQQLADKLEYIAIPRQWRFLSQLPKNAQSKLNKNYMKSLFENLNLPVVLASHIDANSAEFKLEFIPELAAFNGHFPDHPIYPGVGQIAFIQKFAKEIWADLDWCTALEQIKFQELIQPHAVVLLKLERKADKISFQLQQAEQSLASGRLVFATTVKA